MHEMRITPCLLIIAFALTFMTESYSQIFGVKAGLNLSKMLLKDDDDTYSDELSNRVGYHVAGTVEFPLSEVFSIEPGLMLQTKGFLFKEESGGVEVKERLNTFYVDIPVHFKAAYAFDEDLKMYGIVGPVLGMGIAGKFKDEITFGGDTETDEEDVEWGSDMEEDDLKRLDFALTFGAGVQYMQLIFEITYDLGLANISAYTDDGATIKNRVLRFTVGYKFNQ